MPETRQLPENHSLRQHCQDCSLERMRSAQNACRLAVPCSHILAAVRLLPPAAVPAVVFPSAAVRRSSPAQQPLQQPPPATNAAAPAALDFRQPPADNTLHRYTSRATHVGRGQLRARLSQPVKSSQPDKMAIMAHDRVRSDHDQIRTEFGAACDSRSPERENGTGKSVRVSPNPGGGRIRGGGGSN